MSVFNIILFGSTFLIVALSLHLCTYKKGNILLNRLLGQILLNRGFFYVIFILQSAKLFPQYVSVVKLMMVFLFLTPPVILFVCKGIFNGSNKTEAV
jgi:hypothetical protein